MSRHVAIPRGAWPAEMRAETAAAYVDEPSVEAFLKKVPHDYSEPARVKGSLPKWSRKKLDRDIARRQGLQVDEASLAEDVEGLI
jgi:hypothetical protein